MQPIASLYTHCATLVIAAVVSWPVLSQAASPAPSGAATAAPAAKAPAAVPATPAKSAAPAPAQAAAPAKPAPAANAVPDAPSFADFVRWHRMYLDERGKSAKGAACIRSSTCISDESDYFRHIEAAYKIQKSIEGWAKAGSHDAAYFAGLIAFEEAKRFDEEFRIYAGHKDERYLEAGRKFLEASDREVRRAKEFLHPAAYAHRPESCMLMGEVLEYERLGTHDTNALVFYYCAAREYYIAGQRDPALRAYAGMMRTGHPQSPMIIEMHARLFPKQPPNLWRPISPASTSAAPGAAAGKVTH